MNKDGLGIQDIQISKVAYKNHTLVVEYKALKSGDTAVEKPSWFNPHPDFAEAFSKAAEIFVRHMELRSDMKSRITPLEVCRHSTDDGIMYTINAELSCEKAKGRAKIRTPRLSPTSELHWNVKDKKGKPIHDPDEELYSLTAEETKAIGSILTEAALFVIEGKQGKPEQPDLLDGAEENAAAEESGSDGVEEEDYDPFRYF